MKRIISFSLILVMLAGFVLPLFNIFVRAEGENIALGKTVTASSQYNEVYTPDKITDGDDGTDTGRWNSQTTRGSEWVIIDLGKSYTVSRIVIKWWSAVNLPGKAQINLSDDSSNWSEPFPFDASDTLTDKINFDVPVNARYVRFEFDQCASDWGYSINEIEIYETPEDKTEYKNLALYKPAVSSSDYNEIYTAEKLTDGIEEGDTCRWNSKGTRGEEWIIVDLERVYSIFRVNVLFWSGLNFGTSLKLLVSLDGEKYTEVYSLNNDKHTDLVITLDSPVEAEFVKVVFNGCVSDWGYSVNEIKIYSRDYIKKPNLALNKNVYVSESDAKDSQKVDSLYVNDGDLNTRWDSYLPPLGSDGYEQWLTIDLGAVADISEISIYWRGQEYYAKDFTVSLSEDGSNFGSETHVKSDEYNHVLDICFPVLDSGNPARYVRFEFHVPSSDMGYSVSEIEIYGNPSDNPGTDMSHYQLENTLITDPRYLKANTNAELGYYYDGLDKTSTVTIDTCEEACCLGISYTAEKDVNLDVYINGSFVSVFRFHATGKDTLKTSFFNIYVPEGSVLTFVPSGPIGLDSINPFDWNVETVGSSDFKKYLTAEKGNPSVENIITGVAGASEGTLFKADKDTVFSYSEMFAGNNLSLKYIAEKGGKATVTVKKGDNAETYTFDLTACDGFAYSNLKIDMDFVETLEISFSDGVFFDYAEVYDSVIAEPVNVVFTDSKHSDISLDGIWECAPGNYSDTAVPECFDNTIPVPGLWDLAEKELGSDKGKALWYQKTVNITQDVPEGRRVFLKINKAYYGRTVFVNGEQVGKYYYNFTSSEMDITDYLVKGRNTIQIKVGSYDSGCADPDNPAHMGRDQEKTVYYPGIVDSVSLIVRGSDGIEDVQVAPDIENGRLRVTAVSHGESPVVIRVYELGVYNNGVPASDELVAEVTAKSGAFDEIIDIKGFDKSKAWTPDNPYLYRVEIENGGDIVSKRFGMRTVGFDAESGKFLLNGEIYYLRGTNICINRFYEDELRADHPWDEQWVRTLFSEFKYVNWNSARFCIGFPPEFWYDICDEIGFLVVDEYPYWHCDDNCKYADLVTEVYSWVIERQTHPCVIFWDIQNESDSTEDRITAEVIAKMQGVDIQNRKWENGWGKVYDINSPYEMHIYNFIDTSLNLSDIGTSKFKITVNGASKFNYLNEYGWLWVTRNGIPTLLSSAGYQKGNWGTNREEYLNFYATAVAQMTERFRVSRKFFGIMQFCGLSYSRDDGTGYTADILMSDISTPEIRPEQKEKLRSAFAPVGIVINDWSTSGQYNCGRKVPVILVNDLGEDIGKEVTVELFRVSESGQELVYSVKETLSAKAYALSDEYDFTLNVPNEPGEYLLVAKYLDDDLREVSSVRYLTLTEDGKGKGLVGPDNSGTDNPDP
ncbi:MAG: discoidin domain-containing protein, partial [Clostridia bacterium]|nr:discoidin domain-containing protein [Clostridia bacterium]